MPYNPRPYNLLPMPQSPPLNVAGLMDLARFASQDEQERSAQKAQEQEQALFNSPEVQGDNGRMATVLRKRARSMPDNWGGRQLDLANAYAAKAREDNVTHYRRAQEMLGLFSDDMDRVLANPALYPAVRENALPYLPREIASQVPVDYNEAFVRKHAELGRTGAEQAAAQAKVMEEANAEWEKGGDTLNRDKEVRAYAEKMAAFIDPADPTAQEQWDAINDQAENVYLGKGLGAYSPENLAALRPKPSTSTSVEAGDLDAYARKLGKPVSELTHAERMDARRLRGEAGREPDAPGTGEAGTSQSQLNVALRWLKTQKDGVNQRYAPGSVSYDANGNEIDVASERTKAMKVVEDQFLFQIQAPPRKGRDYVLMQSPDGEFGWVHQSKAPSAQKVGGILVPLGY